MDHDPQLSAANANGQDPGLPRDVYLPLHERPAEELTQLKESLIINADSYRYYTVDSARAKMQGLELARQAIQLAHPETFSTPGADAALRTELQSYLLEAYESTGLKERVYSQGLQRFAARYALKDLIDLSNEIAAHAEETDSPKLASELAVNSDTATVAKNLLRLLVLNTSVLPQAPPEAVQ